MKRKIVLILIGVLIFAFGTWHFSQDILDYWKGKQTYSQLGGYAIIPNEKPKPIVITEGTETDLVSDPDSEEEEIPITFPEVDFVSLKQINSEIIAWIYAEDSTINYPVAHNTKDNFFYLDHMFTREGNGSGCIYLDKYNAGDFSDDNSIIYGHNMKNNTMFASLLHYREDGYYEEHPRILLVTPTEKYSLELFAGIITAAKSDDWKQNFTNREDYAAWLADIKSRSVFRSPVEPTAEDRIVSLSTCTYEYDDARLLIMGVLKKR